MEGKYTIRQVLEITRNQLGEIEVPVKYKVIADGIWSAVNNLNAVLGAMAETEDKANEDDHDRGENVDG